MKGERTFFGFGLGPIQTGLFLYESQRGDRFSRWVAADIDAELVEAVRTNGGTVSINVAGEDGVRRATIERVEALNPTVAADRERLVSALAEASDIATALPSARIYSTGGDGSVAGLLASAISAAPNAPRVVYAAENNNRAAEILDRELRKRGAPLDRTQIANTVIGKMSGVVADADTLNRLGLTPLTPELTRAVLVEEFNRIQISALRDTGLPRAFPQFEEKPDLLPFEEAKLYGHNAVHALLGYLAWRRGHTVMSDVRNDPELLEIGRRAFLEEARPAVLAANPGLSDPLFTPEGFRQYAEDLLERMVCPTLYDRVCRVIRDPARKLAPDDRLVGTMRRALQAGVQPTRFAMAVRCALDFLYAHAEHVESLPVPPPKTVERECPREPPSDDGSDVRGARPPGGEAGWSADAVRAALRNVWGEARLPDAEEAAIVELVAQAQPSPTGLPRS